MCSCDWQWSGSASTGFLEQVPSARAGHETDGRTPSSWAGSEKSAVSKCNTAEQESIAVRSREALVEGLAKPKGTFRQRNLYCQFDLGTLADNELLDLEAKATRLGDCILAGHLLRDVDGVWP